jgi:hypothetical protein
MGVLVQQGNRYGLYVTDYRDLIRELNRIQPSLVKDMQKEYKVIAKPVQSAVKTAIPSNPPTSGIHKKRPQRTVSGFYPRALPGRETWSSNAENKNIPVKSVLIQTPSATKASRNARRFGAASIARLAVRNPGLVIADMAGKTNKVTGKKPLSRKYKYTKRNGSVYERQHRLNGQGRAMIRALGGTSSRYIWPAAERAVPATFNKTNAVLQRGYDKINRRMAS